MRGVMWGEEWHPGQHFLPLLLAEMSWAAQLLCLESVGPGLHGLNFEWRANAERCQTQAYARQIWSVHLSVCLCIHMSSHPFIPIFICLPYIRLLSILPEQTEPGRPYYQQDSFPAPWDGWASSGVNTKPPPPDTAALRLRVVWYWCSKHQALQIAKSISISTAALDLKRTMEKSLKTFLDKKVHPPRLSKDVI